MKKILLSAVTVFMVLALTGCGHDHSNPAPFVTQILSDPTVDGDILQTAPNTFTVTQGMSPTVQSVFAGIDPSSFDESRAFLDFPLTGPNGVPGNAFIVSATLDIVLDNVFLQFPGDTVPIRIDLVSIPTLSLVPADFSLPAIDFMFAPSISSFDIGRHVFVDVTPLMVDAQNLGLLDFQIRILDDLGTPGLIEINDTTASFRGLLAPLLQVEYL